MMMPRDPPLSQRPPFSAAEPPRLACCAAVACVHVQDTAREELVWRAMQGGGLDLQMLQQLGLAQVCGGGGVCVWGGGCCSDPAVICFSVIQGGVQVGCRRQPPRPFSSWANAPAPRLLLYWQDEVVN